MKTWQATYEDATSVAYYGTALALNASGLAEIRNKKEERKVVDAFALYN